MTNRPARANLDTSNPAAATVITDLIATLQSGFDSGDADRYDAFFAADILWGTPKGQWVSGFTDLNEAHHRMMNGVPVQPESRFELINAISPAPGVVVAQIRRSALNGGFSEVAMYVLVRRGDHWWLAAAQNTPVTNTLPS